MNYRKLLLTLLLQVLVLAGYFLLIRPLRAWYGRLHLELIFQRAAEWPKYLNDITLDGITLNFYFQNGGNELVYSYAPQFGFFFLLALLGLIFFRPPKFFYIYLILFHLMAEVVAVSATWLALNGILAGFFIADFILLYLSPLVSLGFVVAAHLTVKPTGLKQRPEAASLTGTEDALADE